jgi:hypothetical protein
MGVQNKRQLILDGIAALLRADGYESFVRKGKETLVGNDKDGNRIKIPMTIKTIGALPSVEVWAGKSYPALEAVMTKYCKVMQPSRIPFDDTLRFSENMLNGIYSATSSYRFEDSDEGLDGVIRKVYDVIKNHILPFLSRYAEYEGLHELINTPPETWKENYHFFVSDGMTPFRKMVIAKWVNKDYDAVCEFVLHQLIDGLVKAEVPQQYEVYRRIYFELKEELDG